MVNKAVVCFVLTSIRWLRLFSVLYNKYQMVKAVVCFVLTSIRWLRLLSVLYNKYQIKAVGFV